MSSDPIDHDAASTLNAASSAPSGDSPSDSSFLPPDADPWAEERFTAALVLEDGTVLQGYGLGAAGSAVGELCFNTAMTGYQEILTDPSYAGQIITFTFPHIGNVGTNREDSETANLAATSGVRGCVLRANITSPSNYRASQGFDAWLKSRGIIAIAGIDTRALTARIRETGMPKAVIAHDRDGKFDIPALLKQARDWPGIEGLDLAREVTAGQSYSWDETTWEWNEGFGRVEDPKFHVVAIDYGMKRNILRCLSDEGCKVTVLPATATADDVLARRPDGVFLSNGPGDPAAMGDYAVPAIRGIVKSGVPVFGICLGHQLLALALGAKTRKMHQGHHGANHPVKDFTTGKVEITSMNHGFTVDRETLPSSVDRAEVELVGEGTIVVGAERRAPDRVLLGACRPLDVHAQRGLPGIGRSLAGRDEREARDGVEEARDRGEIVLGVAVDEQRRRTQYRFTPAQARERVAIGHGGGDRRAGQDLETQPDRGASGGGDRALGRLIAPREHDEWPTAGRTLTLPERGEAVGDRGLRRRQVGRLDRRADDADESLVELVDSCEVVQDALVDPEDAADRRIAGRELDETPAPQRRTRSDRAPVRAGQRGQREAERGAGNASGLRSGARVREVAVQLDARAQQQHEALEGREAERVAHGVECRISQLRGVGRGSAHGAFPPSTMAVERGAHFLERRDQMPLVGGHHGIGTVGST
jgi:carbamoyl-phosphate synthase small subunit